MTRGLLLCLSVLISTIGSCRRTAAPAQKLVRGRVVAAGQGTLVVRPPRTAGKASTADQTFLLDPHKTVLSVEEPYFNVIDGSIRSATLSGSLADLRAGQIVSVSSRGGVALGISAAASAPVRGEVTRIDDHSIRIRPEGNQTTPRPEREFSIAPAEVTVVEKLDSGSSYALRKLPDVKTGDYVQISDRDGRVRIIGLVLPPPVQGRLVELHERSIVVQLRPHKGQPDPPARQFAVDPAKTRFSQLYMGLGSDLASFADLEIGQSISVFAKGEIAEKVQIVHGPIYRTFLSATDKQIVVTNSPTVAEERFVINPATKVQIARVTSRSARIGGGSSIQFIYEEGYRPSALRQGDKLSLSVRNGIAVEIRVEPRSENTSVSK